MTNWLTTEELAEYLKISKESVYKFARSKQLPSSKINRQWRFNKDIIDNWLLTTQSYKKKP
ncbi:MAG: helix-turn-helix domain-containing protein [Elusimicrobiota bacterium]